MGIPEIVGAIVMGVIDLGLKAADVLAADNAQAKEKLLAVLALVKPAQEAEAARHEALTEETRAIIGKEGA